MDLYEYQGKELFRHVGIPVGDGRLATTPGEARQAAEVLGGPVVVKAQVLTGGRGKAGGVKLAGNAHEAEEHAKNIIGLDIKGHVVKRLWIEQASDIAKEYYLSLTFDRGVKKPLFMFTTQGGIDIEQVAAESPDALVRLHVDPLEGFHPWQARRLVYGAGVTDPSEQKQIVRIIGQLYDAFVRFDAMLCEVNPLIVTPDGIVKALDSKFTVDDNALYRHPEIAEMRDEDAADPLEALARAKHVTYVKLDGEIGVCGNGAGLTMSTVDVVTFAGGRPANFCDLGGGGDAQGVVDALSVITRDPQVKAIFFNIFGGITRCDEVARGILQARRRDGARAADGRPPRRHERRGGAADPRRGRSREPSRLADDARGGEACRGAGRMTDVWSERAEQYRTSDAHREGPDLDLLVEWAAGARTALDVATGGGHVARRLREAGIEVVSCDPAPGMQPDVVCRAEHLPFADDSFDVVATRVAAHHFDDVAQAVAEMARVAAGTVLIVDNLFMGDDVEEAEKLRDPSHVRNYSEAEWRAFAERGGPRGRGGALLREADRAAALARPLRLCGRRRRAESGSFSATASTATS